MEVDPIFDIASDPVAMLEARSELRAMEGAWGKLQDRDRLIVKMWLEGHTQKAAGEAIGRSSVRTRQLRARALNKLSEGYWKRKFGKPEKWIPEKWEGPPQPTREEIRQRENELRAYEERRQEERRYRDLMQAKAKAARMAYESNYSSGRIVRNGVEVWPPWPKRK